MRVCVFGAGAVGGVLAARLALAGAEVSCIARGAHLEAMARDGLTLIQGDERRVVRLEAAEDAAALGRQDYVVLAVKAPALGSVAAAITPLLGPETCLISAANGLPWWYFYRHEGALADHRLESIDPDGALWRGLDPARTLGLVLYCASEVVAPGVVRHLSGEHFVVGEPDGSRSARAEAFTGLMRTAGFDCRLDLRIRDAIWAKLWGNLAFNPIGSLTGATLDVSASEAGTRALARAMMVEAAAAAEALGIRFPMSVEERIDGAVRVGAHKTSMLQDLERGRPMEIDVILGAVVEIGRLVGHAMPTCDSVLALLRQRARLAGCY